MSETIVLVAERLVCQGLLIDRFGEPEVAAAGLELMCGVGDLSIRLAALIGEPQPDAPKISQEYVDRLLSTLVGEEYYGEVMEVSDTFEDLNTTNHHEGKSRLYEVFSEYLEPLPRSDMRHKHVAYRKKAQRLTGFWHSVEGQPRIAEVISLDSLVARPIVDIDTQAKEISQTGESLGLSLVDAVRRIRGLQADIDPQLDLGPAKLLIATEIIKAIVGRPTMRVYEKIVADEEPDKKLDVYHTAAHYISELEKNDNRWRGIIKTLNRVHDEANPDTIANELEFVDAIAWISELSELYRDFVSAEEAITRLPKMDALSGRIISRDIKYKASALTEEAVTHLDQATSTMDLWRQQRLTDAPEGQDYDKLWQDALYFEELRIAVTAAFIAGLEILPLPLDSGPRSRIDEHTKPSISDIKKQAELESELSGVAQELERLSSEFDAIESLYCSLSGKTVRARRPDLNTQAKQLHDLIGGHISIDGNTSRDLVGLMTGLYFERTGVDAGPAVLAERYFEDIVHLKELGSSLAYLSKPTQSRLVKLFDTLDKLIERGTFNDVVHHPEVNVYRPFIKEYQKAKGRMLSQDSDQTSKQRQTVS